MPVSSLAQAALTVLTTADPWEKARLSRLYAQAWLSRTLTDIGRATPPDRPARPERPALLQPRDMPKRRKGLSQEMRVALLHALAHIELNAIDLAWDIACRFPDEAMPLGFYDDWVTVAGDEAKHFLLLSDRLAQMDARYGDLPAHDGLWQSSEMTAHDLAARLAVVPMVLEARGLDVTPGMLANMRRAGDEQSAAVLQIIYDDEVTHVSAGTRWFRYLCAQRGWQEPLPTWQQLVRSNFGGSLKRPFNTAAREQADFPADWYEPLADLADDTPS
jgi:uncharacterized ferritin-like protein (DUF455 family)